MRKLGIWIDQKEANLITLTKKSVQSKIIYSEIETRIREEGEKKQFGRFGDQYMVDEKGKENRIKEYTNKFLQKIVKELAGADEILLFGPAQMKFKLEKIITDTPDLALKLKATNTSGNMTHNQKLAYVRDFYKIS
ncbi:hypothetical protein [Lutimonas zeaxanthinifaciens]|uniref:hypothetical protein n=1 Tax=Lutimonas zeaxanthinifaciens TaxID=3060215 RepID=UPI00265CAAEB|nr:hypothetical protein [Lutimonas sp. YSD2104]WKK66894.1 hypothetical protein QZH61_04565 [Lutimonas sp. YSD2104]